MSERLLLARLPVMDEIFKHWTLWLAVGVEAAAGLVIAIGAIEALLRSLRYYAARGRGAAASPGEIRLQLGRWLAVGLEFELAADILRTAVAPTWNEIAQLAAIVVLRTALNFFLQKEIDQAATRGESPVQGHERAYPAAAPAAANAPEHPAGRGGSAAA